MPTTRDPLEDRSQFLKLVILPTTLVVLIGTALLAFALVWATNQCDSISMARQKETAERALGDVVDELAYQQQSDGLWNSLGPALLMPAPDYASLHVDLGFWLFSMFDHEMVFILDTDDHPTYASLEGRRVTPESFEAVRASLKPLVDGVRNRLNTPNGSHDRNPDRPPAAKSTARTFPTTVNSSDFVTLLGRPTAASIMRIPNSGETTTHPERGFLIVDVRFLDSSYLGEISSRFMLTDLRFVRPGEARPGNGLLTLQDERGSSIAAVAWRPELPGTRILHILIPAGVLADLSSVVVMIWLTRWLWRLSCRRAETVTRLLASEARANHFATHDVVTGLANRAAFDTQLKSALTEVDVGCNMTLLMLDLDRFKEVNDNHGHLAGDRLLKEFGRRLAAAVRKGDMVARIGGDEFCILRQGPESESAVEALCQAVLRTTQMPFEIGGKCVPVGVSIGVAQALCAPIEEDELKRRADLALYQAKAEGRNRRCYFKPELDNAVALRNEMEHGLRQALVVNEGLFLHYQPIVRNTDHKIVGLEALVRWKHPTRGLIPPDQFIPIAEDTGLIVRLGDWVLQEALQAFKEWPDLFLAINLSPLQLQSPSFAGRVSDTVRRAGRDPAKVEFEITERTLLADDPACEASLRSLRESGFRITIDDFGSGYSNFGYLCRMHFDKIKIDKFFVQNAFKYRGAAAIVKSLVGLGSAMGVTVTAEGVETCDEAEFVSLAGCDTIQGFLFSKPIPHTEVFELLLKRLLFCDIRAVPLPEAVTAD